MVIMVCVPKLSDFVCPLKAQACVFALYKKSGLGDTYFHFSPFLSEVCVQCIKKKKILILFYRIIWIVMAHMRQPKKSYATLFLNIISAPIDSYICFFIIFQPVMLCVFTIVIDEIPHKLVQESIK